MAKLSTNSKPAQDPIPADGYDAWCYGSVEMGTQDGEYEGVPTSSKKVRLFFEIPELPITYEKNGAEVTAPRVINTEYTNSAGKKAKIKPILEAWLSKPIGDIDLATDVVGVAARISVINVVSKKGSTYANISGIGKCKAKDLASLPAMHNPPMVFSVDDHGFDSKEFENLYDWLKEDIQKSHEYKEYKESIEAAASKKLNAALPPKDRGVAKADIPSFEEEDLPY